MQRRQFLETDTEADETLENPEVESDEGVPSATEETAVALKPEIKEQKEEIKPDSNGVKVDTSEAQDEEEEEDETCLIIEENNDKPVSSYQRHALFRHGSRGGAITHSKASQNIWEGVTPHPTAPPQTCSQPIV